MILQLRVFCSVLCLLLLFIITNSFFLLTWSDTVQCLSDSGSVLASDHFCCLFLDMASSAYTNRTRVAKFVKQQEKTAWFFKKIYFFQTISHLTSSVFSVIKMASFMHSIWSLNNRRWHIQLLPCFVSLLKTRLLTFSLLPQ